jgi:hypothetical protein
MVRGAHSALSDSRITSRYWMVQGGHAPAPRSCRTHCHSEPCPTHESRAGSGWFRVDTHPLCPFHAAICPVRHTALCRFSAALHDPYNLDGYRPGPSRARTSALPGPCLATDSSSFQCIPVLHGQHWGACQHQVHHIAMAEA